MRLYKDTQEGLHQDLAAKKLETSRAVLNWLMEASLKI
jgi:predicted DNA-binding protein (UPF0251 family)